jgi:hypothetical protein
VSHIPASHPANFISKIIAALSIQLTWRNEAHGIRHVSPKRCIRRKKRHFGVFAPHQKAYVAEVMLP